MKTDKKYILAIDQGTTSSRAILFDRDGRIRGQANREFKQIYPEPGWVEHNPNEIWESVRFTINEVLRLSGASYSEIDSIGITNQRETTVIWDRRTGRPIHNAIVWQCRRTSARCNKIKNSIYESIIYNKTGLIVDPYFCATKIEWILSNVDHAYSDAEAGHLAFGTIDSWLIYNLTGGANHITDYSNASRTMLFNIHTLEWDSELLEYFNIPGVMMPDVVQNSIEGVYSDPDLFDGNSIPITGIIGDQQGALFGQCCFNKGDVKNTYGTGCFLLMNIGSSPKKSNNKLLTTIAWSIDGEVTYAMEGAVFIGGAAVQWLRDGIAIIQDNHKTSQTAVENPKDELVFVPAFSGLGSPYWDPDARGAIFGISRDTDRNDIVKATLQGIAFQTADLYESMSSDFGGKIGAFKADGGASRNQYLMQFQADIIRNTVFASVMNETTALGAAYLAGLSTGFYPSKAYLKEINRETVMYKPQMDRNLAEKKSMRWKKAIASVRQYKP